MHRQRTRRQEGSSSISADSAGDHGGEPAIDNRYKIIRASNPGLRTRDTLNGDLARVLRKFQIGPNHAQTATAINDRAELRQNGRSARGL
jgi:hypothetical protein